jgi:hypothetical protein
VNVIDPRDIVDIDGLRRHSNSRDDSSDRQPRRFLSVWFRCCHTYGRMYRNAARTAYEGRCPKCGALVRARIGPNGTTQRMFEAR